MRVHYGLKALLQAPRIVRGAHRRRIINTAPRPVDVIIYIWMQPRINALTGRLRVHASDRSIPCRPFVRKPLRKTSVLRFLLPWPVE